MKAPKVSRKSINKIYVQNKIVCKGESFEEHFAALELVLSFLGNVNLKILKGYLLNFREFQYLWYFVAEFLKCLMKLNQQFCKLLKEPFLICSQKMIIWQVKKKTQHYVNGKHYCHNPSPSPSPKSKSRVQVKFKYKSKSRV